MDDLDPQDLPNATVIKCADQLFISQQAARRLDGEIDGEKLEELAQEAYYRIFGIIHAEYLKPDASIPLDIQGYMDVVYTWGRSQGHSRTSNQATRSEMDAIAEVTGAQIPRTPAAAAGGRANLGGYYPWQTPKGKGKAGRSTPYPQTPGGAGSSSSGSTWWPTSEWSDWSSWSWTGWSGRGWWW